MRPKVVVLLSMICLTVGAFSQSKKKFVQVSTNGFELKKEKYRFIGANFWQGIYLGMAGEEGDRDQLIKELDALKAMGVTNLRILGSSEGDGPYQIKPTLLEAPGKYNEKVFEGLDYLLAEMGKRDMKAVVALNNFWMWSGGMPQYVSWSTGTPVAMPDISGGGSWDDFINYSLQFFEDSTAQSYFIDHLEVILNRKNSITGKKYKKDPTIMSWQLSNEPRGYHKPKAYREWIAETAAFIKSQDNRHMVSVGAEGDTGAKVSGTDLYKDNMSEDIDYATVHVWIQNWGWYDPEKEKSFDSALKKTEKYLKTQLSKAEKLGKPVVIEEFGVSRDSASFASGASTQFRDTFYEYLFKYVLEKIEKEEIVQGCNFWAWAGDAEPPNPGGFWQQGDPLIGDPPHELQGWYSVYSKDNSTCDLIKKYSAKLQDLQTDR